MKVAILGSRARKTPFHSPLSTVLADRIFSLLMKMEATLRKMVMARKMMARMIYPEMLKKMMVVKLY